MRQISNEDLFLKNFLREKYPVQKLERPLFWGFIFGISLHVQYPFYFEESWFLLRILGDLLCFSYFLIVIYSTFCAMTIPETKEFFNVIGSIKKHEIRSFSTTSKVVHLCIFRVKGVVATGGIVLCGPKILFMDPFYRGSLWNDFTYPYTGMKAASDIYMMNANHLLSYYPEDRLFIMKSDGVTIDGNLLREQCQKRNLPLFPNVQIEDKFPSFSWWPWKKS